MRRLALLLLTACANDFDGDGFVGRQDCDDADPLVNVEAVESCNGRDDDCDAWIDEDVAFVAFWDQDADGFGDPAFARRVCALPADGSLDGTDCDDADPNTFPGAAEACDAQDDDCDGVIDDGVAGPLYADADEDGHGAGGAAGAGCPSPGWAATADDCDDADPSAFAGAAEVCDGADNDCDGDTDEGLPSRPVWADTDDDGGGDPGAPGLACGSLAGWSTRPNDCDDDDPSVGPRATDTPNGEDDDCDGFVDEVAVLDPGSDPQAAVDGAPDGAVVQLGPGTFFGVVDLRGRDLTFAGSGCDATTLYADGEGPVVAADGGAVRGLTLAGGVGTHGAGLSVSGDVEARDLCVVGNHASGDGGGVAVLTGSLSLVDARIVGNSADRGGGLSVARGATLVGARVEWSDNEARVGGHLWSEGADIALDAVTLLRGRAREDGGAVYVEAGRLTPGSLRVDHATFRDNRAQYGQAVYNSRGDVRIERSILAEHTIPRAVVYDADAATDLSEVAFVRNAASDLRDGHFLPALRGAPPWVSAVDSRLRPRRVGVDATSDLDRDGTAGDLGAWGGPASLPDPVSSSTLDADRDGVLDGDELAASHLRYDADGTADLDGDGLDLLSEVAVGSNTAVADTDADGVGDGVEAMSGLNPNDPSDQAPLPVVRAPRRALRFEPITLDGSASGDPNGDHLDFVWTAEPPPGGGSAAPTPEGPSNARFAPDTAGTWRITLTVSDGTATRSRTVDVTVHDAVVVPDDAPTVAAAAAAAPTGGAIAVRAGRWDSVDFAGKDLTIFGIGAASQVVLDAGGAGPVVTAAAGEDVALAHLTLTGGTAAGGGGLRALGGGAVELWDVTLRDNAATGGGGGALIQGDLVAVDVTAVDNRAATGAGVQVTGTARVIRGRFEGNVATAEGGGLWVTGGTNARHFVDASVFAGNRARTGAAMHHLGGTGILWASNVVVAENAAANGSVNAESGTIGLRSAIVARNVGGPALHHGASGRFELLFGRHAHNQPGVVASGDGAGVAAPDTAGGAVAVAGYVDDGGGGDDWSSLRGSAGWDTGHVDDLDVDGSRADLGPAGGPHADPAARVAGFDVDRDGLADGWERAHGLVVGVADEGADRDDDGLDNAAEHRLGTSPDAADSDHDGVSDPLELDGGYDPTFAADHRPTAVAVLDGTARVGIAATLDGRGSSDPNGDPLTFRWTVAAAPAGSALVGTALASSATPTFVADRRGSYDVTLVVSDAAASSLPARLRIDAAGDVTVPGDAPTLAAAFAGLLPEDTVRVGPGVYELSLDSVPVPFRLEGAGSDETVFVAAPGRPHVSVGEGERVTLANAAFEGGVGLSGGAVTCRGGRVDLDRVSVRHNASSQGGGVWLRECTARLTDVEIRENRASGSGGGLFAADAALTWVGGSLSGNEAATNGGGAYVTGGSASFSNVRFDGNRTPAPGGAVYATTSDVTVRFSTLVANRSNRAAITASGGALHLERSIVQDNDGYGVQGLSGAALTCTRTAFWRNGSGPASPAGAEGSDAILAEARFVSEVDRRLRADSPARDAGAPLTDRDGTSADLGAFGGPFAPADSDAWYRDADGDGLPDGWEDEFGFDVAADDRANDDDHDGLVAAGEWQRGTDPTVADTDGDGLLDGVDPAATTPADGIAIANAGADVEVDPFEVVSLDSSGSTGATRYVWTIVERPRRSTASLNGAFGRFATLTPDRPGRYVISLVVSPATSWSVPDTVVVDVRGDLAVPDDYADADTALAVARSGATVTLAPGAWPARVALAGRDLTVVGAGPDETALVGALGSVFSGSAGEALRLEGLTVEGAVTEEGGAVRLVGVDGRRARLGLADVRLADHRAVDGGALFVEGADVTATDVEIVANAAARHGGGAFLDDVAWTGTRARFADNRAVSWWGGGAYVSAGSFTLDQAIFADNVATAGAALYADAPPGSSASLTLRHVTAVANDGAGGASFAHVARATATVEDSVVAYGGGPAIVVTPLGARTIRYTTFHLNDPVVYLGGADPIGVDGNEVADPAFVAFSDDGDPSNDDLRLAPSSPARDTADPVGARDRDGSLPDRGAYGGPAAFP
jgi:hypothetical protein